MVMVKKNPLGLGKYYFLRILHPPLVFLTATSYVVVVLNNTKQPLPNNQQIDYSRSHVNKLINYQEMQLSWL